MKTFFALVRRDVKLFFKDKGMFFSSLITPMILLVLYGTFLANVYRDSFESAIPGGFEIPSELISGTIKTQLISSLLAVSCVTISFCSNLLMIQDKANNIYHDFTVTPVKRYTLGAAYYVASALTTVIVTFSAFGVCLLYLSLEGWYMTFLDVILVFLDVLILTLFGTALSSCVNFFLSTNGQASIVGTIVSACYGFISGAYMPIASFGDGLQKFMSFLPGTYGTSLLKNHLMRGVFEEMGNIGMPSEVIDGIKKGIDCKLSFFGNDVSMLNMYIIIISSVIVLTIVYIIFNVCIEKKRKRK